MTFFAPDPVLKGAACADLPKERQELFFTADGYKDARKICLACPVREECLEIALNFERGKEYRHGMWGATTVKERRRIEKQRRMA